MHTIPRITMIVVRMDIISFILLGLLVRSKTVHAVSDPNEVSALRAIKDVLGDEVNRLHDWIGDDPCGTSRWTGVYCGTDNGVNHIQELRLMDMNFTGTLSPYVGNLTHMLILNFMWNKLTGPIPAEIGKLGNLTLLLLNGNKFTGILPPELGNLSKMNRLQIDSNSLTGPLPSSFRYLSSVKHIHLNNNSLTGEIPVGLGELPVLLHLLLDNNNLRGRLPPDLSNISSLVILQLDNNKFSGSIPSNYSKLQNLSKLSLRNCNLSGSIPDFSGLPYLAYLDLSGNQLNGSLPSLSFPSDLLTTIDLSSNHLDGEIPMHYLQYLNLEVLLLDSNLLDGNVNADLLNHKAFTEKESVLLIYLQNNNLSAFVPGAYPSNVTFRLYGNPLCHDDSADAVLCSKSDASAVDFSHTTVNTPAASICSENTCDIERGQELVPDLLAGNKSICHCAYPLVLNYRLKSPSFVEFPSYISGFIEYISSNLKMEEYQINIPNYHWQPGPRLAMTLKLFPNSSVHEFDQVQVEYLYEVFSSWSFPQNNTFGPYELLQFSIGFPYIDFLNHGTRKGLSSGALAGIIIAAIAITTSLTIILVICILKKRSKNSILSKRGLLVNINVDPCMQWHSFLIFVLILSLCWMSITGIRKHERIKVAGVRSFSHEDMKTATNNFGNIVGKGGYGNVYRGVLKDGQTVAIKRAEPGSLQGLKEFSTEIELLSRLHHRNLVSLVGYCDDQGEQILVYEYIDNGTLRSHLDGGKEPLSFAARIQIALDSAKAILYLHTEVNPPVYHRDIKSSNILLDKKWRAKVSDFGLSKLGSITESEGIIDGGIFTAVKGTPGYLDPEYFLTHKLTDKSIQLWSCLAGDCHGLAAYIQWEEPCETGWTCYAKRSSIKDGRSSNGHISL
ncbi:hypothetical protein KP509_24G013400 [Ceratopteris richardii]|uniref:Protein kinase domain-containing protein n=1 Tax=Ceratopteris richardii TaxID=49495 RepID=A0A8T2RSL3_CERRI|nr:hypothetical protein KP509_24G013400 [Ceratopteris richardii]